jgi:predicted nucleotidyltransferase
VKSATESIRRHLIDFLRTQPVLKAELFGLCAKGIPETGSIELLVTPTPGTSKYQIYGMEGDLEARIGRRVSILVRPSVEAMKHSPARNLILQNVDLLYEQTETEAGSLTSHGSPPTVRIGAV